MIHSCFRLTEINVKTTNLKKRIGLAECEGVNIHKHPVEALIIVH